jgi:hypothetical protein
MTEIGSFASFWKLAAHFRSTPRNGPYETGRVGPLGATIGLMHCTKCASLDHLIGAAKQRWRDVDAELSCRLEINDQFELGGLHNRQV